MNWIYQHPDWPRFHWDTKVLETDLAEVRHRQGKLIGRLETLGFELRKEASLTALTSEVVKSSAIEGEILDRKEVRSSIARRLGLELAGLIQSGRDVDGVVEMMVDATRGFRQPLSQDRLFAWHASLFPTGRSGMQRISVGSFRSANAGPMQVVSGPIGKETLHFEAPPADSLVREMKDFLDWFEAGPKVDPVIKAAIAHFWFVTIHPFEDGNGRIARAIADLALARADGIEDRFYSMSSQIELERKDYYERLERQQRATPDITMWLEWFLGCLRRSLETAEDLLAKVLFKSEFWKVANSIGVNERQKKVLNKMLGDFEGHMKSGKYARIAKCSTDTALRDISSLVNLGLLKKNPSSGRSSSYRLPSVEELR